MAAGSIGDRGRTQALRRRRPDGSVVTAGIPRAPECRVDAWRDIVAVAAGNVHTAANTGRSHTVGLRGDGTVVAVGWNGDGQCDVAGWTDVVSIAAGWRRTLAVRADGTVGAAGRRSEGACEVDTWSGIVAVAAGDWHSVGLRADGTAAAVGNNRRGQCEVTGGAGSARSRQAICTPLASPKMDRYSAPAIRRAGIEEVSDWDDVLGYPGSGHTVGVDARGRGSRSATTAVDNAMSRRGGTLSQSLPAPCTPSGCAPMASFC